MTRSKALSLYYLMTLLTIFTGHALNPLTRDSIDRNLHPCGERHPYYYTTHSSSLRAAFPPWKPKTHLLFQTIASPLNPMMNLRNSNERQLMYLTRTSGHAQFAKFTLNCIAHINIPHTRIHLYICVCVCMRRSRYQLYSPFKFTVTLF